MSPPRKRQSTPLADLFDQHQYAEFALHDADAALETMADNPSVHLMAVLAGGAGREEVRRFYSQEFIPKLPPDMQVTLISRTIGADRLVDENVVSFTHSVEVPWALPGVQPTGKRIEIPVVVIVEFERGKIARERVYWDQASALAQAGLISAAQLPVVGRAAAQVLLEQRGASAR